MGWTPLYRVFHQKCVEIALHGTAFMGFGGEIMEGEFWVLVYI